MYFRSSIRDFSSAASRSMLVAGRGVLACFDVFDEAAYHRHTYVTRRALTRPED